jgi:hypothetical protein
VDASVSELRGSVAGAVLTPDDIAYERARVCFNALIDRRPAVIVRCLRPRDVATAFDFARSQGLEVAVRGGGHNPAGHCVCDGGLVIDLTLMNDVEVDGGARIARSEGGATWLDFDAATQRAGMVTPGGVVGTTGVAGLTFGGGIGHLTAQHGLTCDNLVGAEVVTPAGEVVRAGADGDEELLWGLRGGGGNFGIATEFEYSLEPVGPTVLAGPIMWRVEDWPKVLRFYRDWVAEAPDELMTIVVQRKLLPLPFLPEELHGELVLSIGCCYAGSVEEGEEVVRPLREAGSPILDLCVPKPYLANQAMFDASFPHGWWYYFRACDVAELSDDVIDVMVDHGSRIASPVTTIALWQLGGAIPRVSDADTAFTSRDAAFTFNINGNSTTAEGFDAEREWARAYWSALEPHHMGVYVNFLMDQGTDAIRQAYGSEKYDRLKALKRKYDPDNFFRLNQNISPD